MSRTRNLGWVYRYVRLTVDGVCICACHHGYGCAISQRLDHNVNDQAVGVKPRLRLEKPSPAGSCHTSRRLGINDRLLCFLHFSREKRELFLGQLD